jgi:hypothetical protein
MTRPDPMNPDPMNPSDYAVLVGALTARGGTAELEVSAIHPTIAAALGDAIAADAIEFDPDISIAVSAALLGGRSLTLDPAVVAQAETGAWRIHAQLLDNGRRVRFRAVTTTEEADR